MDSRNQKATDPGFTCFLENASLPETPNVSMLTSASNLQALLQDLSADQFPPLPTFSPGPSTGPAYGTSYAQIVRRNKPNPRLADTTSIDQSTILATSPSSPSTKRLAAVGKAPNTDNGIQWPAKNQQQIPLQPNAPRKEYTFVPPGCLDPGKGRRRPDDEDDYKRKNGIQLVGGVCSNCRKSKRKCDEQSPCSECAKKNNKVQPGGKMLERSERPSCTVKMLPKDVFSLFGSESLHICKWAHQFSLSRNDLDGGAFVYLEVDSGADSSPNPFPLALRKMVAHDKEPRGIFDMGLAIPKLVSALLPTTELRRENDPDPTASLAAWNVWKTVIAIRIFLFSSVSTPVLSAPLARKICGLLLAQVLDLFRLQMEILDKEIQTLSYPDGHCFRGWKSNLCSIDLYIQALRAFENIETSGMLRNLFGPLQESVTATVVSLNELYEIANPNLKRCGNPQRTKIRRKQSQPSITGCRGAQIAIYPYSEGQSIPSTAGRGYAPYDEPKVIVAHLLTPDDAYKYIPDYVQQQFYSPDQLWPTPHPYQLSEENLRANIPFTRERGTISSGDVEAQSTVLSQDDTALSTTYSATVAPSIAASDFLSSVNGQTFQDPPKCIDPKVIYQEPLTMNLPPKPPNTLRTGFRLESSTQTPTFREPKRKQRSKGSSSQSPDRRKRPTMFNNPFAPLYGKRSQL